VTWRSRIPVEIEGKATKIEENQWKLTEKSKNQSKASLLVTSFPNPPPANLLPLSPLST
jgi:predicted NAD/FAD-dependent oxidoreductase